MYSGNTAKDLTHFTNFPANMFLVGVSSNINEVIRVISCFFHENILHTQKSTKKPKKFKKHKKHKKQTSDFHSDVFYTHKKHKK